MDTSPGQTGNCEDRLPRALERAAALCDERHMQFTAIRRRVLETLLKAGLALGAYDIQALMRHEGQYLKPPTIYRALDFLTTVGLVHRIESLNAYIACAHCGDASHQPGFRICRRCGQVEEIAIPHSSASTHEFRVERTVYEVKGLCEDCYQVDENGTD